jgi:peptidyl-tRNA hydrolase
VVRKDLRLDLAAACPMAGAAAVACTRAFEPRLPEAFLAWRERPRKVALRASAEELERLPEGWRDGDRLVCLPPRLRSRSGELVASLIPFTDARRPAEPTPPPDEPALTYVVASDLGMTTGKAMAQAGHAALMCADGPDGDRGPRAAAWAAWARAGRPPRSPGGTC